MIGTGSLYGCCEYGDEPSGSINVKLFLVPPVSFALCGLFSDLVGTCAVTIQRLYRAAPCRPRF
jgi:hypothetical protein